MDVSTRCSSVFDWLLVLFLAQLCAISAGAKPRYGDEVDSFCALNSRTPPAPYSGNCSICHNAADNGRDRTPGFSAYKDHRGDGDFSYFCPAANQPPVIVPIGNQLVSEQGLLDLLIRATDPNGDALTLTATGVPTGALFADNGDGTASFVWMPGFDRAGNYPVLFKATDNGAPPASSFEEVIITVGNVNRPPVLEPIGNQTVQAGDRLDLVLRSADPDRDPVTFSASGMPANSELIDLSNGTAEFRWLTLPTDSGNFNVTFTTSDTASPPLSDAETITISVGSVNRPPVLAPIGNQQATPGTALSITITALDPDTDGLRFNVVGLPSGAIFTDAGDGSAVLDWTPGSDQAGNYSVTCTVSDDAVLPETASETFVISVGGVNRPPVLDEPVVRRDGERYTIALTARDPDADALRFRVEGLPAGAIFLDRMDGTAEFSWTPAASITGGYTVIFSVTDNGTPPQTSNSRPVVLSTSPPPPEPRQNAFRCGIGFELAFVLPPLMWLRSRRKSGASRKGGEIALRTGGGTPR